jgi:hypothetical protein
MFTRRVLLWVAVVAASLALLIGSLFVVHSIEQLPPDGCDKQLIPDLDTDPGC